MALTVEDGTGKSDADSYISLADADAYNQANGNDEKFRELTSDQREEKLRLATKALDLEYDGKWKGTRRKATQVLEWPRCGVSDPDGHDVSESTIPQRIKDATVELAIGLANGSELHAVKTDRSLIKKERSKLGDLEEEVEYGGGGKSNADSPSFPKVKRIVRRYLVGGGMGYATRS